MQNCIENYINGNLTDAQRLAKRHGTAKLINFLREEHNKSKTAATAIVAFLKGKGTFQAACNAEQK